MCMERTARRTATFRFNTTAPPHQRPRRGPAAAPQDAVASPPSHRGALVSHHKCRDALVSHPKCHCHGPLDRLCCRPAPAPSCPDRRTPAVGGPPPARGVASPIPPNPPKSACERCPNSNTWRTVQSNYSSTIHVFSTPTGAPRGPAHPAAARSARLVHPRGAWPCRAASARRVRYPSIVCFRGISHRGPSSPIGHRDVVSMGGSSPIDTPHRGHFSMGRKCSSGTLRR